MLFVWHAVCSMGERTARDDEKIRVSDAIQVVCSSMPSMRKVARLMLEIVWHMLVDQKACRMKNDKTARQELMWRASHAT